ncbi:MAG: hypothetical protein NZ608_07815, partial [candidate division WOR-3 bacterium]|nr:hypothetical protein [candidate division WOR-3 bacterium]
MATKIRLNRQTKGVLSEEQIGEHNIQTKHIGNLSESRVNFDVNNGHNHNGINSKKVSHNDLKDITEDQHHRKRHKESHYVGGDDALEGELNANARVNVQFGGQNIGKRRTINFNSGANVMIDIRDNPENERVNVNISAIQYSWAKEFKVDWNGINQRWELSHTPISDNHLLVFKNGLILR